MVTLATLPPGNDVSRGLDREASGTDAVADDRRLGPAVLYRCVPESRDGLLAYRLPDVAPADLPTPRNAGFRRLERWVVAGWQVVGGPVRRAVGERGRTRATLGACDFCYLWQSLEAGPTLAGRSLELSARVLATRGGNSCLWIKADLGRGERD